MLCSLFFFWHNTNHCTKIHRCCRSVRLTVLSGEHADPAVKVSDVQTETCFSEHVYVHSILWIRISTFWISRRRTLVEMSWCLDICGPARCFGSFLTKTVALSKDSCLVAFYFSSSTSQFWWHTHTCSSSHTLNDERGRTRGSTAGNQDMCCKLQQMPQKIKSRENSSSDI